MISRLRILLLLSIAVLLLSGASLPAGVISINFSGNTETDNVVDEAGMAGQVPVGNFNNLSGTSGTDISLIDDSGADSGATVTFSGGSNVISNNIEMGNAGDNHLFRNSLHQRSTGDPAAVTIVLTNIPYVTYEVYVYFSSPFGARIYSATINESNEIFGKALGGSQVFDELNQFIQAFAPNAEEAVRSTHIFWESVTGSSFSIRADRFMGPPTPDGPVGIAGLQIVEVAGSSPVGMHNPQPRLNKSGLNGSRLTWTRSLIPEFFADYTPHGATLQRTVAGVLGARLPRVHPSSQALKIAEVAH